MVWSFDENFFYESFLVFNQVETYYVLLHSYKFGKFVQW